MKLHGYFILNKKGVMMKKNYLLFFVIILSHSVNGFCDGLLLPTEEGYPGDLLRNRMTEVKVTINGLIAETEVYQEFVNEWYDTTDAVYSFPLPPDARATEFVYWYNDVAYNAVLKVKEQAVNPGTGEGGIAALVNEYIGRNGIKIKLSNIAPGSIQRVRLHYISLCEYHAGKSTYTFPLKTDEFITYPLDHLEFSLNVFSNSEIIKYEIPSHSNSRLVKAEGNTMTVNLTKPKAYLTSNFEFNYYISHDELDVDFYSNGNDSTDGHFALFIRPENTADPDSIFPKRILFLLSNSNGMYGTRLNQSITSIKNMLDKLSALDEFNIILFNNSIQSWKSNTIPANSTNIDEAKVYLESISTTYGSELGLGLKECLSQITDNEFNSSIVVFTSGFSPVDPVEIEDLNTYNTGIFPVGIGSGLDRAKLEMTAALNYGFVTYIEEIDDAVEKIDQLYTKISEPILQNVIMEFGSANPNRLIPQKAPTTYAGSYFFTAGRYENAGPSILSIGGSSVNGMVAYDFNLDFNADGDGYKFVEYLWAKEMIDALEQEIEIYGETESLKDSLIELSLKYNIRCRYTAYVADYETVYPTYVTNETIAAIPTSFIQKNYPNPFNPATTIRFFIGKDNEVKTKLLKIYNILGQLVAVIDISHLASGWHEVQFDGRDFSGNQLPSGVYFVQLQIKNKAMSTIKINLIR